MNFNKPKKYFKKAREDQNLSIEEVANRSNIHVDTLKLYEKNQKVLEEEHYVILKPLLHLEQFNEHDIYKDYYPLYLWDCLSLKPYENSFSLSFIQWIKKGFNTLWLAIKNDRVFKQLMIILLITAFLAGLTEQLAVQTLVNSAFIPVGLSILMYTYTKEKNLKGFDAVKLFIYGGLAGMALVYIIREFTGFYDGFAGDVVTGIVEEFAKVMIVMYALHRFKVQTVKGGILIGFLIGAGFDAFETADYAIWAFMDTFDYQFMHEVINIRSAFALFGIGHHFWTAILAGTLVYIKKTETPKFKDLLNITFIQMFIVVVLVHALWNFSANYNYLFSIGVAFVSFVIFLLFLRHANVEEDDNNHMILIDLK